MYKIIIVFLLILASPMSDIVGQTAHTMLLQGNKAYEKANYATAEENYRKAAKDKSSFKSDFNLANALYKQERFEEASQYYQSAISKMKDGNTKSQALHNLGNSLFQERKLKESIQAYKDALRISPKDLDTKYNLQKAKQLIKMKPQQQNKDQDQQDKDQQDQYKKDQENKDQQDKDQDQKDQEDKDQQDKDKQDKNKKDEDKKDEKQDQDKDQKNQEKSAADDQNESSKTGEEDKQTLDKEDALKLLQVIENEEKKVQEKLRRINSNTKKPEKDW